MMDVNNLKIYQFDIDWKKHLELPQSFLLYIVDKVWWLYISTKCWPVFVDVVLRYKWDQKGILWLRITCFFFSIQSESFMIKSWSICVHDSLMVAFFSLTFVESLQVFPVKYTHNLHKEKKNRGSGRAFLRDDESIRQQTIHVWQSPQVWGGAKKNFDVNQLEWEVTAVWGPQKGVLCVVLGSRAVRVEAAMK